MNKFVMVVCSVVGMIACANVWGERGLGLAALWLAFVWAVEVMHDF